MTEKQQRKYNKLFEKLKRHPNRSHNSPILWVLRYKYKNEFYVREMNQYFDEDTIYEQMMVTWFAIFMAMLVGVYAQWKVLYHGGAYFTVLLAYCTLMICYVLYKLIKYKRNCEFYQFLYATMKDNEQTEKTYKETLCIKNPRIRKIHKFFH